MFPTTFFSFLLTFQTRPSSLVPKPPSPTTSLQVLQALPHNSPPPFSLSLPLASLHSHPSLLLPQPPPHLLTRYPFMSLMIPFFLSSPILPHIFLSPTLTFLQAPLHFPHDPLTALSLSFPFISLQFHTSTLLPKPPTPSPPSLPSWSPSQSPVPSLRTSSSPPPFTPLLALGANYSAHKVFLISFSDTFNPRILLILGYF